MATDDFQVTGDSPKALFTMKLHRGDGMALVAMNWKKGKPPKEFVGFGIEYKEPGGDRFYALKNRLTFEGIDRSDPANLSSMLSPIQKFRWVHFPRNANLDGEFRYRVTPIFMNAQNELSSGEPQDVGIELRRETYPGVLNCTFTRGFVSSQAFAERYEQYGKLSTLIASPAKKGLTFKSTHPKAKEALAWMGFEAREAILETLDEALKDKAEIRVVAYDLNEPEIVNRLEKAGKRLKIIIDDSADHGEAGSAENQAEKRLAKSAGKANVKRQHMTKLQHNKTIVVDGPKVQKVVCGSTNMSWRGIYVQSNNAMVLMGKSAVKPFLAAFDNYWNNQKTFGKSKSAEWSDLELKGVDARVAFSPHGAANAQLKKIADDVANKTTSSLLYSLAFLFQTEGPIKDAIKNVSKAKDIFVYGISDKKVGGLDLMKPDGNVAPVYAAALEKDLPEPFSQEPAGGGGARMHHKFLVIDFDKPTARVYLGSYNFSGPADTANGENLLLVRDRRIAVSYMIEALRIFDHYHFRVVQAEAKKKRKRLELARPPRNAGEKPWWDDNYTNARKARDRELFS